MGMHLEQSPELAAVRFAWRYRHPTKQAYAERYLRWLLDGQPGPEPQATGLSIMARQGIRWAAQERANQLGVSWDAMVPF